MMISEGPKFPVFGTPLMGMHGPSMPLGQYPSSQLIKLMWISLLSSLLSLPKYFQDFTVVHVTSSHTQKTPGVLEQLEIQKPLLCLLVCSPPEWSMCCGQVNNCDITQCTWMGLCLRAEWFQLHLLSSLLSSLNAHAGLRRFLTWKDVRKALSKWAWTGTTSCSAHLVHKT